MLGNATCPNRATALCGTISLERCAVWSVSRGRGCERAEQDSHVQKCAGRDSVYFGTANLLVMPPRAVPIPVAARLRRERLVRFGASLWTI